MEEGARRLRPTHDEWDAADAVNTCAAMFAKDARGRALDDGGIVKVLRPRDNLDNAPVLCLCERLFDRCLAGVRLGSDGK